MKEFSMGAKEDRIAQFEHQLGQEASGEKKLERDQDRDSFLKLTAFALAVLDDDLFGVSDFPPDFIGRQPSR